MINHYRTAKFLVRLLDNKFNILGFKFGLDPLIGLIPGLGDVVAALVGLYIIWVTVQLRVPEHKIPIMLRNFLLDLIIGTLPVVGDLADFVFKSNQMNWRIIEEYNPENIMEGEIVE